MRLRGLTIALLLVLSLAGQAGAQSTPVVSEAWETDPGSERFPVTGTALDALDEGEPGELSVVAIGETADSTDVPVIVRNNTEDTLSNASISIEARSADDDLLAVSNDAQVWPFVLEPGALGLANVRFDAGTEPPADAVLTTYVEGSDGSPVDWWYGLTLTEYVPDAGIGGVTNDTEFELDTLYMRVACFSPEGDLQSIELVSPSLDVIPAGETSPFRILLLGSDSDCANFLFIAFGNHS